MEAAEGSADAMGHKVFFNDVSDKEKKLYEEKRKIDNEKNDDRKYCENIAQSDES